MASASEIRKIFQDELTKQEERIFDKVKLQLEANKKEVIAEAKTAAKAETLSILGTFLDACKDEFIKVYTRCEQLEKESLAAKSHSMKYNLLISGIEERGVTETYQTMTNDVIKMLRDVMEIEAGVLRDLQFKAIHRLGKASSESTRTIIIVVNKLEYVGAILKNGKKLKGTAYSVRTHLPTELAKYRSKIVDARKELISADKNRKIRVTEYHGIPQLQELRGNKWHTLEDYYNQPLLHSFPKFMPLIDLQNEMFTGDLNDSGRGRGIRGLSGINPLNSTPDTHNSTS